MIALLLLVSWSRETQSQEIDPNFQCPVPTGLFTDPSSCNHYYNCASHIAYRYKCPEGTLWDLTIQSVSWFFCNYSRTMVFCSQLAIRNCRGWWSMAKLHHTIIDRRKPCSLLIGVLVIRMSNTFEYLSLKVGFREIYVADQIIIILLPHMKI